MDINILQNNQTKTSEPAVYKMSKEGPLVHTYVFPPTTGTSQGTNEMNSLHITKFKTYEKHFPLPEWSLFCAK